MLNRATMLLKCATRVTSIPSSSRYSVFLYYVLWLLVLIFRLVVLFLFVVCIRSTIVMCTVIALDIVL